jgi:hypothetical protein
MKSVIITIIVYTIVLLAVLSVIPAPPEGRYYDCSMAEFHPDIPKEVREQCRELRRQQQPKQSTGISV